MRKNNLYIDFSRPIANEKMQIMEEVIDELNLLDRDLICMYYGFGEYLKPYTMQEIGDELNITKQAVCKKLKSVQKTIKCKIRLHLFNTMQ